MDLRWAGAVRRRTSDESGGLVTSIHVGTAVSRSALVVEGGGPIRSSLADGGVRADVRRMGEKPDARVSRFGRFRL